MIFAIAIRWLTPKKAQSPYSVLMSAKIIYTPTVALQLNHIALCYQYFCAQGHFTYALFA